MEVQRVSEGHDERFQFTSRQDAVWLDESLDADDVSRAWLVWSGAAEVALPDAFRFSGGPVPAWGLVLAWAWERLVPCCSLMLLMSS